MRNRSILVWLIIFHVSDICSDQHSSRGNTEVLRRIKNHCLCTSTEMELKRLTERIIPAVLRVNKDIFVLEFITILLVIPFASFRNQAPPLASSSGVEWEIDAEPRFSRILVRKLRITTILFSPFIQQCFHR